MIEKPGLKNITHKIALIWVVKGDHMEKPRQGRLVTFVTLFSERQTKQAD